MWEEAEIWKTFSREQISFFIQGFYQSNVLSCVSNFVCPYSTDYLADKEEEDILLLNDHQSFVGSW